MPTWTKYNHRYYLCFYYSLSSSALSSSMAFRSLLSCSEDTASLSHKEHWRRTASRWIAKCTLMMSSNPAWMQWEWSEAENKSIYGNFNAENIRVGQLAIGYYTWRPSRRTYKGNLTYQYAISWPCDHLYGIMTDYNWDLKIKPHWVQTRQRWDRFPTCGRVSQLFQHGMPNGVNLNVSIVLPAADLGQHGRGQKWTRVLKQLLLPIFSLLKSWYIIASQTPLPPKSIG